ncbi:EAL domain-containing protein (plasmid) [Paraburkholderia sp. PREW-6R]|uniref:putative bifunctional diguanylate cyclase/phosphodiesterase n=1 Tax=Paraburkholderia sp. PREW-6R TaxID=3141544 RepID=UPI0031F4BDF6
MAFYKMRGDARMRGIASGRSAHQYRSTVLAALLAAIAAGIMVLVALGIFASRERADARLHVALAVANDVEVVLALHMDANSDFLKGVGSASYRSYAWPVARAGAAAAAYGRLEEALDSDRAGLSAVRALRALTAAWSSQLETIAHQTHEVGSRVTVASDELLLANETLNQITRGLSALRGRQEVLIAAMHAESEQRLAHERLTLLIAIAIALLLLTYAFFVSHRASLSKARIEVIAAQAESRFYEYFAQHPLAMMIYDLESLRILAANAAAERQYGYSAAQFASLPVSQLRPESDLAAFLSDLEAYRRATPRSGSAGLRRHLRADGSFIFVQVSFHFLDYAGHEACFITAIEVTEHEQAKRDLYLRSRALDATLNAVAITQFQHGLDVVSYVNPAFERITGYAGSEIIGKDCRFLLGDEQDQPGSVVIRHAMRSNSEGAVLLRSVRRSGEPFWNQLHVAPVFDDAGVATHHISVFSDVSELVNSQELLRQQARHDALTLLPNRHALTQTLGEMLGQAKEKAHQIALAFVDLDNFKDVNDTLGHSAGDLVLRNVASRLRDGVGQNDFVARYGGDEFVVLFSDARSASEIEAALSRLKASIAELLTASDMTLHVEASIGWACYPQDGRDAEALLSNADMALYSAKSAGRNRVQKFDPAMAKANSQRLLVTSQLRAAIERAEFELHYQPRVCESGRVLALEALLRWRDPAGSLLNPGQFIPQAEENGLIVPIGDWVLNEACAEAKRLCLSYPDIRMSVNVSPVQFAQTDMAAAVASALARTGLDPRLLEIEITEGALMEETTLPTLQKIRRMGVSVAIDDFGVGYSSLGYVRNFKADTLKIDMSFVRRIGRSSVDEVIVKAIIGLGHTLGMRVVGEGVETTGQRDYLLQHGCHELQGYLYARPMPAAQARQFISHHNADSFALLRKECEASG